MKAMKKMTKTAAMKKVEASPKDKMADMKMARMMMRGKK